MAARIALVHAAKVAIPPVEEAFRRHWPEAELANLLDDSLSRDRNRQSTLTPDLGRRIAALAQYGIDAGANAVLYTCSAFGEAIEAVKRAQNVPVLRPNEAMLSAALRHGRRIGMLATFAPTVPALDAGDRATHDRLLALAAPKLGACDVVMLAQFSMAGAREAVAKAVSCPVLTSPDSAVLRLRELL